MLENLPPEDGQVFYHVSAVAANGEYPGDSLRYLTLEGHADTARYPTEDQATAAMRDWAAHLKGAWYLEVERGVMARESDPESGYSWWDYNIDYDHQGKEAWWNHDDGRVEVSG